MIRDFWVKNYLSILDKQELNFVAKGPSSELVTEVADFSFCENNAKTNELRRLFCIMDSHGVSVTR